MSLNIKNRETFRLAHELADLTGESVTAAVTTSVRERLERVQRIDRGSLSERLLQLGREVAARLPDDVRTMDHGEHLYDEAGLPR
jgi:antitoxin VapB